MHNNDVISSLPDDVLCNILSFLPTKQAVTTSILSKRWTHLWRSVPVINFKEKLIKLYKEETRVRFNNSVYSVLLSRGSNSIKSFSLKVKYNFDTADFGFSSVLIWINHVVRCGVETLDLGIGTKQAYTPYLKFPISILSCRTLVVLKINGLILEGFSSITLPSLKILHLENFQLQHVRDLVLLLAGCPILEDLYAFDNHNCGFECEDSLTYQDCESLSLSKLTKAQMPYTYGHFPLKALYNVDELYIEIVQMCQSFDEIPTFHNLTKLTLHSIDSNWDLLVQVLNHCPKLQNVDLCQISYEGDVIGNNVQENWVDPKLVPQCLSLHLKTCRLWYFQGQQGELMLARYILNNARVLQTMTICCPRELKNKRELSLSSKASPTCELIFHLIDLQAIVEGPRPPLINLNF